MDPSRAWLPALSQWAGSSLLDLFFPPNCAGCQAAGDYLCPRCAQEVEPLPRTICRRCGRIQPEPVAHCADCRSMGNVPIERSRAAALFTWPLREAIYALKYEDCPQIARELGRYLAASYGTDPVWRSTSFAIDAVVPVPLHAARLDERGYNQSELLAEAFCGQTGIVLQPRWLARIRPTRQQVGLNAVERRANVSGAFGATGAVAGRVILLIDDVYTTGATLTACALAAQQAGAKAVYALTLAIPAGGG